MLHDRTTANIYGHRDNVTKTRIRGNVAAATKARIRGNVAAVMTKNIYGALSSKLCSVQKRREFCLSTFNLPVNVRSAKIDEI